MTLQDKLRMVKSSLSIDSEDITLDSDLYTYLEMSEQEILNWMYINKPAKRAEIMEVPQRYEMVQINAVVTAYNHRGAEGEKVHNENGINRTFVYDDMVSYIRHHVYQKV